MSPRANRNTDRTVERKALGLQWRDWYLFKAHEWTRLFGETPTALDWNLSMARSKASPERLRLIESRHEGQLWPSSSSVVVEFGSWNAMMDAAGLPKLKPGSRKSERGPGPVAQQVLVLYLQGLRYEDIALRMGLTTGAVSCHITNLRKHGVHVPYRREVGQVAAPAPQQEAFTPEPELLDRIAELWGDDELWADGSGLDAIAERVDLSPGIVLSHVRRIEGSGRELPERVLVPPKVPLSAKVKARRERVAELWRKGISAEDIALELGVSRSTVQQDASRLRREGVDLPKRSPGRPGIPRKKLSRDQLTIVKRLRAEGWTAHRIAALLSLPERTIEHLAEVEDSRRAHLQRRRARIRVMRHAGLELSAIAERLGVAEQVVAQDLRVLDFGDRPRPQRRRKMPAGYLDRPDGA